MIYSYRDLIVWQKSIELVTQIYKLTEVFPRSEQFGLISQMRRAAVSVSSNIAEGRYRGTRKDFRQFLIIAFSSGAELETQLVIAKNLSFVLDSDCKEIDNLLNQVMKMLNAMISKLAAKSYNL